MGSEGSIAGALFVALAIAIVGAGCGGSSSSADSSTEASAAFIGKGENGKLATFGREASDAEREAASRALEENLEARATGHYAKQCASLSAGQLARTEKKIKYYHYKGGCPKALESEAGLASPSILANTMTGQIDVLRVSGKRGFAFYHGTQGKDYAMPMIKEGGEWKVNALVTEEVP